MPTASSSRTSETVPSRTSDVVVGSVSVVGTTVSVQRTTERVHFATVSVVQGTSEVVGGTPDVVPGCLAVAGLRGRGRAVNDNYNFPSATIKMTPI
ncbi:MAG: hypothetical protein WCL08_10195, partial [Verrucomicrobiota bacterium]